MKNLFQLASALTIGLLISACGGPSGGSAGETSEQSFSVEPGINLYMSISSTGEESIRIPANDDANVDILFLDESNNPVANEIVNLSASSGTLSQSSILTSPDGTGTVTIFSPGIATGSTTGVLTGSSDAWDGDAGRLNYEFFATNNVEEDPDAPQPAAINFEGVSTDYISLKGTGDLGYGETAIVTFKVVDSEGFPLEGVIVSFNLSTEIGGLSVNPAASRTNSAGEVTTTVLAGTVPTTVRVGASVNVDGELKFTQSNLLVVTTGIPDQNSFDMSVSSFSVRANEFTGNSSTITVRLGDAYNNPVPDGTPVYFTTEGGLIGDTDASTASCQTANSSCSVLWTGQNPRPDDHRSTILAYVIGNETFYDPNGSGVFDDGDSFDDLAEPFRDDDESGTYNPTDLYVNPGEIAANEFSKDEKYFDYNDDGVYSLADTYFNGIPCNHSTDCPPEANNPPGRESFLTYIYDSATIIMASDSPIIHILEIPFGEDSCLNSNGKFSGLCSEVTNFGAGEDQKRLWIMIEDTAALCRTLGGDRINGVIDPESSSCEVAIRQSAPTDAAISVTSDANELIGESTLDKIPNTIAQTELLYVLVADGENTESKRVSFDVSLSFDGLEKTVGRIMIDPADAPAAP